MAPLPGCEWNAQRLTVLNAEPGSLKEHCVCVWACRCVQRGSLWLQCFSSLSLGSTNTTDGFRCLPVNHWSTRIDSVCRWNDQILICSNMSTLTQRHKSSDSCCFTIHSHVSVIYYIAPLIRLFIVSLNFTVYFSVLGFLFSMYFIIFTVTLLWYL